ncbi:thiamine pyrophosphate-binding protein [Leucobacter sp. W1478]|uniref:thiamine pyrophosphate-binding protein n=1 Tax=Leucobacter sp. W1478 TaxID=3439065 RepID=UPI003F2F1047
MSSSLAMHAEAASAPQATRPTLAQAVAAALARHTDHAFGLMGNGNAHLIDALAVCGIPLTEVRHEAATVASADAYTRVSGKLAIATTTYGAGFTNALTALAEAAQARTPLLLVVGDAPTSGPRAWDVDQEMMGAALGVRSYLLSLDDPGEMVDRAAAAALRGRRPVILGIPYDLATAPVASVTEPATSLASGSASRSVPASPGSSDTAHATVSPDEAIDLEDPSVIASLISATLAAPPETARVETHAAATLHSATSPHPDDVAAAVRALAGADRPLILAGHGAWLAGAGSRLGALADQLGALTASTALARGIFPRPEFDLGLTGGFGQDAAMAKIAEADVVLVVGASLNQFTMRFGELFGQGATVVRVDLDQVASPRTAHPITHLLLNGDANVILDLLSTELEGALNAPSGWRERTAGLEAGGELRSLDTGGGDAEGLLADGRLDPRMVATRLAKLLPEDRYVTSDGGHFIGWANMYWPVTSPERMIMVGTAYQTIGLGLSTVAGVAAAAPESTVVLTTGDGGGLMSLADLETAIRTTQRCIIVVWNDGAYGAEVHLYGRMGLDQAPMLIPDVNFAGLASALGATGVRVDRLSDLAALESWRDAGGTGTILLDCRISRSVVAPYQYEILKVNGVE